MKNAQNVSGVYSMQNSIVGEGGGEWPMVMKNEDLAKKRERKKGEN